MKYHENVSRNNSKNLNMNSHTELTQTLKKNPFNYEYLLEPHNNKYNSTASRAVSELRLANAIDQRKKQVSRNLYNKSSLLNTNKTEQDLLYGLNTQENVFQPERNQRARLYKSKQVSKDNFNVE